MLLIHLMFKTPYQESQFVYLMSKFIHFNTVRGGGYAKYYGLLQWEGGLEMAQKTITYLKNGPLVQ